MKHDRIFSYLVILTLVLSYISMPAGVTPALASTQPLEQRISKPAATLSQAAQDPCALLAQGSGTLAEMVAWTASCPQTVLRVKKIADAVDVFAGDPIGFMISITNLGSTDMIDLAVHDQLDPAAGWTVNHPDCSIDNNGLLTCRFSRLPAGWTVNIHISAISTPAMCGELNNIAVASVAGITAGAHAIINIHCRPDIRLEKTPGDPSITTGDTARYTLVVTNIGEGRAEDVILTDTLPTAAGLSWSVESVSDGETCSITSSVLSCNFGSLDPSETRTVVVSSPTTEAICTDINNDASVTSSNEFDRDRANNEDSATITVSCTTLELEKLADADEVNANDPIGFTITVTNTGTSTAQNVVVSDNLPIGVDWSEESSDCSISSGSLSCSFGDLGAGESASVHITGNNSANVCGRMTNTATATADNITGTVTDMAAVNVICASKISVVKRAENNVVNFGSPVRFTMTITNYGTAPAEDVTLSDPLPPDTDLTWSYDNVSAGGTCAIASGFLDCSFGTLPAGESASVRISAVSSQDTCGYMINTVTAESSNAGIVTDIAQVNVLCDVNVKVTKTAERAEIASGEATQPARFTILVENNSPYTANNVILTDPLPTINSLAWVIDSASAGSNCSIASGTLTCNIGSLAPGAERTIVISSPTIKERFCRVSASRIIENLVTVSASNEPALNIADNTDYARIDVLCNQLACQSPDGLYSNDFNNGIAEAEHWSSNNIMTSPNGTQTFLGELSNSDLFFNYEDTDVDGHYMIFVSFDLYIIRSWDGNVINHEGYVIGPDHFQFNLLDPSGQVVRSLVDSTFNNFFEPKFEIFHFNQAYPKKYGTAELTPGTGSFAEGTLGYQFFGPRDSVYRIAFYIPHTERNVKLSLKTFNLQTINDESWGIDNFNLRLIRCNTQFFQENYTYLPMIFESGSLNWPFTFQGARTEQIAVLKNK